MSYFPWYLNLGIPYIFNFEYRGNDKGWSPTDPTRRICGWVSFLTGRGSLLRLYTSYSASHLFYHIVRKRIWIYSLGYVPYQILVNNAWRCMLEHTVTWLRGKMGTDLRMTDCCSWTVEPGERAAWRLPQQEGHPRLEHDNMVNRTHGELNSDWIILLHTSCFISEIMTLQ